MIYNKLVRDKIPEIIRAKGKNPTIHIADSVEYWEKLKEKLLEEVKEFNESETLEELADILEVVKAVCVCKNISSTELENVRIKKFNERGGFVDKIILEES